MMETENHYLWKHEAKKKLNLGEFMVGFGEAWVWVALGYK